MSRTALLKILLTLAVSLPALVVRLGQLTVPPECALPLYGAAVVSSAFLLTWAAETAELDISASLAIALLSLIAVLPEYAVDLFFAYTAGHRPEYAAYAAANMTGSNRLLMGLGWPVAGLVFILGQRRRGIPATMVCIEPRRGVELLFLAAAGIYAFLIPLTGRLSLLDAVVLIGLFVGYGIRVSKEERGEPELVGVAARLGALRRPVRRTVVVLLFLAAAGFVLAVAGPFADALVQTGKKLHIDEFLLVQWLAPLASEAPELLVATLLAWRANADGAFGCLLSSKVNQWTLLVGSLPIAYAAGGGGSALPLDARQNEEFLLTAAQTVLGIAVFLDLGLSVWECVALLVLFCLQFPFPQTEVRYGFTVAYLALAAVLIIRHRWALPKLLGVLRPARRG